MKTFFLLGWLAISLVGRAQDTEPGWFNAEIFTAPSSNAPPGFTGGDPNSIPSGLSAIAESGSPEIDALARGLEYDPLRIFNYVHDHIRHVLYFGAKKGAQLTLLERSGNDFDQSALLVALLRAAGFAPAYQFGVVKMPLDSPDHRDLRHWLQLSLTDTNWSATVNYFSFLLGTRGYPGGAFFPYFGDDNSIAFHRVWVKLAIGGTNYLLDPAFKISEPMTGINLSGAMGLDTNALMTAAGGTGTADYVQSLSESSVRNKLRDYTTNFLGWLQSNAPNASVEEILGGWKIQPATNLWLSQTLGFPGYDAGGALPVLNWNEQPTNLMSRLNVSFAGTNYAWLMPALQGQRLSFTFESNGVVNLWQDDTLLVQKTTTGSGTTIPVTLSVNHPHGNWNLSDNTFTDTANNDQSDQSTPAAYQRTNATYAIIYAFEASPQSLRARQDRLEKYRAQGLADTSREVVSETLNVMGLSWMEQSELTGRLFALQGDILYQHHHRFGRMAQEKGKGYYVDVYLQRAGVRPANGAEPADNQRKERVFDLAAYSLSALEHAVIEQFQSSDLIAASTVKMLQLSSTNAVRIYSAKFANWTTGANVRGQLIQYGTPLLALLDGYISAGYTLLLPRDGTQLVDGTGSWQGYGYVKRFASSSFSEMSMIIGGGYNGGFVAQPTAQVNPQFVGTTDFSRQFYTDPNGAFLQNSFGADPVSLSSGAFETAATDLSLGAAEPRGLTFTRHYSSARRRHSPAGLTPGWTHNYFFDLREMSAAETGLGGGTPAEMASMLVAVRASYELYNPTNTLPKNWLTTCLIIKWGVDQLINNSVSVTLGADTVQFTRQPDGKFTPPANCAMTLVKTNSAYHLFQRHGNTFKFNSAGQLTNIVDQYAQSLKLAYNASNWVTTVTDWKNRTLTLGYSGTPSRLTSITDSTGRAVSYGYATTYSAQGDLTSVTDAEGKTSAFLYDTNHQIIATKDALSRAVTSNAYDGFGRIIEQCSQGDTNQTWRFYWSGFVNTEQDPTGAQRKFHFDDQSRQVAVEDALGNVSETVYDGQNHVVKTISPLHEVTEFQFDERHNLVRVIDPLGFTNAFNFDAQDRLTSSVDARGSPSRFGYNTKFQLIGSTNGAGDWQTLAYNATDGTLTTRTDAGGTATYAYDSWGQLSSVVHPGGLGTDLFLNNALGDVLTRTNARGFITTLQYNARRELTNTVAPTNLTARVTYDAVGNVQSGTDARGFATTNFWSATRQPLGSVFPATAQGTPSTTNYYDARDWLKQSVNPLQQSVFLTNDSAGRLVRSVDPLLRVTKLGYDANGRRTRTTNAALEVSTQSWNARGEAVVLTDGATNTSSRGYDAAGNQIVLTNRNGKVWQFQFDGANRLTNTITPLNRNTLVIFDERGLVKNMREPSGQTATNLYDARARLTNFADNVSSVRSLYDSNNNRTAVFEAGKSNVWTFDAYDRVTSYRDTDGNLIQYRTDANGNMTNLVYPGGKTVSYAYDRLNRLTNVTDWASRKTSLEYDLASRLRKITRANGTVRVMDYDAAGELTNLWEKTSAGVPIAVFKLGWNAAARVEWEFAAPLPHSYTPPTRTMTYDDDNRLATFNSQSVTHDSDGNMTSGPLTNSTLTNYTYDARNRLLAAGGVSYSYDALGNRTSLTNGTNVTRYVINPTAALSQILLRVQNGVTNYYVYGAGLLYEATDAGTAKTYHYDYRGSTVALTDGSGNVTDRAEYSPHGTLTHRTGSTDTPFLYNGRYGVQTDPNGLLHMRARYYNPYLGRFVNADPSGFSGGLNFYAYADGNPVSMIDPFGLGAVGENSGWSWLYHPAVVNTIGFALTMAGGQMRNDLPPEYANSAINQYLSAALGSVTPEQSLALMALGSSRAPGGMRPAQVQIAEGAGYPSRTAGGTVYTGGYDPGRNVLYLGDTGHPNGMAAAGGTPIAADLENTMTGLQLLKLGNPVSGVLSPTARACSRSRPLSRICIIVARSGWYR